MSIFRIYSNYEKLIKTLVESIFDDVDFEDSEISVMSTLMGPYEVTKHFDNMSDIGLLD